MLFAHFLPLAGLLQPECGFGTGRHPSPEDRTHECNPPNRRWLVRGVPLGLRPRGREPGEEHRRRSMVRANRRLMQDTTNVADLARRVAKRALPLREPADLDPLLEGIGDARYVLLGEASHGTHEYYTWRAALSRRLIVEKGFSFIAVEGDWPDCYRVNRYIKQFPDALPTARDTLQTFARWPTWMWANEEIVELAEWLRRHNAARPEVQRVGFYGLDVYSLWDSLYALTGYVRKSAPSALPVLRGVFQCFQPYGEDEQDYARATAYLDKSCEDEAVALLRELHHNKPV